MGKVLVLVSLVLLAGCSLPGMAPSKPPSAHEISLKPYNSNLKSATLTYSGSYHQNGNVAYISGVGVIVFKPQIKSAISYTLSSPQKPSLTLTEVNIDGKRYTQSNGGKWNSQTSTSNLLDTLVSSKGDHNAKYVGEETLKAGLAWHLSSMDPTAPATTPSAVDTWIRESDGYLLQLKQTTSNVEITIVFANFNASQNSVTAPLLTP